MAHFAFDLPVRAFRRFVWRHETLIALSRELPGPPPPRLPRGITAAPFGAGDLDSLHSGLANQRQSYADNLARGLEGFAAFRDGAVVGICWFARHERQDWARQRFRFAGDKIYTFSLHVVPAHRRGGLAATLQWHAWERYHAAGYRRIVRLVALSNAAAIKLHLHMGFRPCGRAREDHRMFGRRLTLGFRHPPGRFDAVLAAVAGHRLGSS